MKAFVVTVRSLLKLAL